MSEVKATAVAVRETAIDRMLEVALTRADVSMERLEQLYALKRQYDADEARKEFVAAMAEFKAEPLEIAKDKHVLFGTGAGTTEYWHASIGNVVGVLVPAMAKHGFSHRWTQKQEDGRIHVTCVLTHRSGHSESYTVVANPDASGNKNPIQSIGSSMSYLQRYSLLGVTGYATKDQEDDDGASAGKSEEQIEQDLKIMTFKNQWIQAIKETKTPDALKELKRQLAAACGGSDMIPPDLIAEYSTHMRTLTKAAANG